MHVTPHLFLDMLLPDELPLLLLPLPHQPLLIIHLPGPGHVVLGLAQVVRTLAGLVGGKVEVKLHVIAFLAQVDKEPYECALDGDHILVSRATSKVIHMQFYFTEAEFLSSVSKYITSRKIGFLKNNNTMHYMVHVYVCMHTCTVYSHDMYNVYRIC